MKLVKRGMRYKSVSSERLPVLQNPEYPGTPALNNGKALSIIPGEVFSARVKVRVDVIVRRVSSCPAGHELAWWVDGKGWVLGYDPSKVAAGLGNSRDESVSGERGGGGSGGGGGGSGGGGGDMSPESKSQGDRGRSSGGGDGHPDDTTSNRHTPVTPVAKPSPHLFPSTPRGTKSANEVALQLHASHTHAVRKGRSRQQQMHRCHHCSDCGWETAEKALRDGKLLGQSCGVVGEHSILPRTT